MFQGWRFKLREAEDAFERGRLEEAGSLLKEGDLQQFLPGKRLTAKVAKSMADRAREHLVGGDSSAGWRELDAARSLGGDTEHLLAVRREMVELALNEAEGYLRAGDAQAALKRLEHLEQRGVDCESLRTLKEVTRRVLSAENLSQRGKFADAQAQLVSAARLRPDLEMLTTASRQCRNKLQRMRDLTEKLHRAMGASQWSQAVALADELLELAPLNRIARDARKQAWCAVGTRLVDSHRFGDTHAFPLSPQQASASDPLGADRQGQRFLMWIDAVGGFLVCLEPEISIGQAAPGNRVDVPILGDLSRQHATIRREGEGYVIEPAQEVRVGGRPIQQPTVLSDGDEIELGRGVRLRFRQPHALSASARLDFVSRHRMQPSADGVLLMAESCVLGPNWRNHVVCPDWSGDVVLYRQDDKIFCRAMESLEIDGQLCDGRGEVQADSHIAGSDFSLSLEKI